jgi:Flp pilus assembly pilin Flp
MRKPAATAAAERAGVTSFEYLMIAALIAVVVAAVVGAASGQLLASFGH